MTDRENPDGSESKITHEYDDAGRLTMARTESEAGVQNLQVHEYDNAGRLLRVLARNTDGNDRMVESYEYDASGRKIKTRYADVATQRPDTHYAWGVEGTDSVYSAPGAAKLITLHNDRDQPTKLSFHDIGDREVSRVEFRYNDAGRLIEEAQTMSEEVLPPEMLASLNPAQLETARKLFGFGSGSLRRTHAYDDQGRRIETRSDLGPLGFDRKTVTYNEHDDPVTEIGEHQERECAIDDEGRIAQSPARETVSRSETRFHYEYDSQGNWVSKTVEGRAGTEGDFAISAVERRTITYFA
jgi:YD repeat-containing protein